LIANRRIRSKGKGPPKPLETGLKGREVEPKLYKKRQKKDDTISGGRWKQGGGK